MKNHNELVPSEVMNRDPEFSLKILRVGQGMTILFLVVGIIVLVKLSVEAVSPEPMTATSKLHGGIVFLLLWNTLVIVLFRGMSAAIIRIRKDADSTKNL